MILFTVLSDIVLIIVFKVTFYTLGFRLFFIQLQINTPQAPAFLILHSFLSLALALSIHNKQQFSYRGEPMTRNQSAELAD